MACAWAAFVTTDPELECSVLLPNSPMTLLNFRPLAKRRVDALVMIVSAIRKRNFVALVHLCRCDFIAAMIGASILLRLRHAIIVMN